MSRYGEEAGSVSVAWFAGAAPQCHEEAAQMRVAVVTSGCIRRRGQRQ